MVANPTLKAVTLTMKNSQPRVSLSDCISSHIGAETAVIRHTIANQLTHQGATDMRIHTANILAQRLQAPSRAQGSGLSAPGVNRVG